MPIEVRYWGEGDSEQVVTTACPFCGEDMEGRYLPAHLRNDCEMMP